MSVNVKINPLIWFAWGGFGLLMLGTLLAAWPKRAALAAVPPTTARSTSKRKGAK